LEKIVLNKISGVLMTALRLKVRGGGLFLRFEKTKILMRLEKIPNPSEDGELGLPIVNKTAIVGILARLMGETRRLYDHTFARNGKAAKGKGVEEATAAALTAFKKSNDNWADVKTDSGQEDSVAKLAVALAGRAKILPVMGPVPDLMYERADQGKGTTNPSTKIPNDIDQLEQTIGTLWEEIKRATGTSTPQDAYEVVKKSIAAEAAKTKNATESNEAKVNDIAPTNIPNHEEKSLGAAIWRQITGTPAKPPQKLSEVSLKIIEEVNKRCGYDDAFKAKIGEKKRKKEKNQAGGSVSTSILFHPLNAKNWVKRSSYSYVVGRPSWRIMADFDIVFENVGDDVIKLLLTGPQAASWAEGGRVLYETLSDEALGVLLSRNEATDQIFATRDDLLAQGRGIAAKTLPRATFGLKKKEPAKPRTKKVPKSKSI
jgi:hypothetical protein